MTLAAFQKRLQKERISYAIIGNADFQSVSPNLVYFTGYSGVGFLVVPSKKPPVLIVPEMELLRAKRQSRVPVKKLEGSPTTMLAKLIGLSRSIGILESEVPVRIYKRYKKAAPHLKLIDISDICSALRSVKTKQEIGHMKKAASIADKIIKKTFEQIKKEKLKTESGVYAFMVNETNNLGLKLAYEPIIASGSHTSQAHFEKMNVPLRKGFLMIDFGVVYKGYHSDCTRMAYIGKPTKKELELYDLLYCAQIVCCKEARVGMKASELDKLARTALGKESKRFIHSLGHGVGTEIHECPRVSPKNSGVLCENMVFTIEPGIYYPNKFGIRIEDMGVLTKKGFEIFTKLPKKLLILDNKS